MQHFRTFFVSALVCGSVLLTHPWPSFAENKAPRAATSDVEARFHNDTPPTTAYDNAQADSRLPAGLSAHNGALLRQLGKTTVALLAVIALIYTLAKLVLPRLGAKWSVGTGRNIQVLERIALDNRNAVVLLQLQTGERLLVGTGEHGVQFLSQLHPPKPAAFNSHMAQPSSHVSQGATHAPAATH